MTDRESKKKVSLGRHFINEVWRLAVLFTAFTALVSLIADVYHKLSVLFAGPPDGMTELEALAAAPAVAQLVSVSIPLPDPLAELFIACIFTGVLTYIVLKWVCESQWVQEPVQVKECWEEVTWYNPFSWVAAIVCTVVEVLKWVLKQICGWVEVLIVTLVVICIVVVLVVVML
jgi:hypothetical protein